MSGKLACWAERICLFVALLFSVVTAFSVLLGGNAPIAFAAGIGAAVLLSAGCHFLDDEYAGKVCPFLLFFVRFTIALIVIFTVRTAPVSDFSLLYEAAEELSHGETGYLESGYFYNWAYQTGFVIYQAMLLRLFGSGQTALQIVNALWMAGCVPLVWGIGKSLFFRQSATLCTLLYVFCPGPYFMAGVLTNQHPATFFYYLGIYLLILAERKGPRTAALLSTGAGCVIAVGNILRPLGAVVLLSAAGWCILKVLGRKGPGRLRPVGWLLLAVAAYAVVFRLASLGVQLSGANPGGLINRQPLWKFLEGLNLRTSGQYDPADEPFLGTGNAELLRAEVLDRLHMGLGAFLRLSVHKLDILLGSVESLYWGFGHIDLSIPVFFGATADTVLHGLQALDRGYFFFVLLLGITGLAAKLFKRCREKVGANIFPVLIFCAYLGAHLFIEVQPRYRYFVIPCVFLLATGGAEFLGMLSPFRKSQNTPEGNG